MYDTLATDTIAIETTGASDHVALNPKFQQQEAALLNALLQSSDYGVLVSGLDREDIVANRRLGELFGVSPEQVVRTDPAAVRALALSRVRHPQVFEEILHRVDADPLLIHEDEIELIGSPARTLRRFTAPLHGAGSQLLGRLWTFLDITETKNLQARVQAQLAAQTLEYTSTAAILSVMNGLCSITMPHRDVQALLADIVTQTRHLGGADCSAVLLLTKDGLDYPADACLEGFGGSPGKPVCPLHLPLQQDKTLANMISRFRCLPEVTSAPNHLFPYTQYQDCLADLLQWQSLVVVPLYQQDVVQGIFVLGLPAVDDLSLHVPPPSVQPVSYPTVQLPGSLPVQAILHHLNAIANQITLTLQTHGLQSELHTALTALQTTQRQMVEIEKLRTAGTLAASIAHDIRNIVTSVQIEMEMASLSDTMASGLSDHMNRFSTLTHRLLAFSRPGSLEMHPINIGDTLQHVLLLIAGQAEASNVRLDLQLPESLPPVAADAAQLEHLFVNLCLNGIQAIAPEGGWLHLSSAITVKELEIKISDTGSGIAPDVIDHIFEPFFTTRQTGTGLGLFSCKQIAEEHGGRLTVRSSLTEGTTFTVTLPILQSECS